MRKKNKKELLIGGNETPVVENQCLVPNISYGTFFIGDDISRYMHLPHELIQLRENDDDFDDYFFPEAKLDLLVNAKGKIESIMFEEECYWSGVNLIKLPYEKFLTIIDKCEPDDVDMLYVPVSENWGRNLKTYSFDEFGIMLCVWRGKIITVFAHDFREE